MLVPLISVLISLALASDVEINDVIKRLRQIETEVENYKNIKRTLTEYIKKTEQLEKTVIILQSQLEEQKVKCSKVRQAEGTEAEDNKNNENSERPRQRFDFKENQIDATNIGIRQRKQVINEGPVAFSAALAKNLDHAAPGHVIPFNSVSTNEGNGFNGSDGVFVCPRAGLYLFIWEIFGDHGFEAHAALNVNGVKKHDTHVLSGQTGGGVDIVRLSAGDHVWLANTQSDGGYYSGHTMFSGTYISAQ